MQFEYRVPPASVDDPETGLIDLVVDVVKALVLENSQRDEAQWSNSEVSLAANLSRKPFLHKVDESDGFNSILGGFSREP